MKINPLIEMTFDGAEFGALCEICEAALDAELLNGVAKAMAMAVLAVGNDEDDEDYEPQAQEMLQ